MKFWIGHGAYTGANRPGIANSKAAAVHELRMRGCKRDDARDAVNRAAKGSWVTVYDDVKYNIIEVQLAREQP